MLSKILLSLLAVGRQFTLVPALALGPSSGEEIVLESRTASCASLAQSLKLAHTTIISATALTANAAVAITGGQTACGSSFTPTVNICRGVANITTSSQSTTLSEI